MDDVDEETKKKRYYDLLAVQKGISLAKNREITGTEQEVLVEGTSRMSDKELVGRARNNTSCVFPGDKSLIGQIVRMRIKDASPYTLKGEIT